MTTTPDSLAPSSLFDSEGAAASWFSLLRARMAGWGESGSGVWCFASRMWYRA